ncbi:alphan-acetylglucosamine transferase [Colletotrichum truncatum]|uniref:Alphan-acetylglucosamine transferase n=1 Tax=Colletotrichum truncatum TaxID=5467 RepID=A0ACC3YFN4_COLTU|nr:alphan-acetylglucosamine transferase [Colletotrichum truncatum]KAF6788373.1 alphan-acetylglucosamine transferase [Colletotrichum truncatum]
MFIPSPRRAPAVLLTCVIFVSVLWTSYRLDWEQDVLKSPHLLKNESSNALAITSRFAYAQYATDINYLCNAVINFNRLERFGAQNDMVLIFPNTWTQGKSPEAKALRKLHADHPRIILRPLEYLRISKTKASATWADSLNKFHAFKLTEYERVMIFDSDTQVLNNLDLYFSLPKAPVAVPRAYWLNEKGTPAADQVLSSHVMLLQPDEHLHATLVAKSLSSGKLDMDLVNLMLKDSASILPHRRLALLTGEFRSKDHEKYLAPDSDAWDPVAEVSNAHLVHFSDWPLPKPWVPHTKEQWAAALPECDEGEEDRPGRPRCADRLMWTRFYEDYADDRKHYCKRWG